MLPHGLRHNRRNGGATDSTRVLWVASIATLCVIGVVAVAVGALQLYRQPRSVHVAGEMASAASLVATPPVTSVDELTVEMPNVVGMRSGDAEVVLRAAGLQVVMRAAESTASLAAVAMVVDSQSPEHGVLISAEESVTISLARPSDARVVSEKSALKKRSKYVVCIDPGHQERGDFSLEPVGPGSNRTKPSVMSGATGVRTGLPEYEVALQISMNLKEQLEARGVKVVMTRTTNDVRISNSERAKIANKARADLFIRVHCDGNPDDTVAGVSTLYPTTNRWTRSFARAARAAASSVQHATVTSTGAVDRGAHPRGDLSGFNWSKVPCILIECGFLSNPVEDRLLASPHYQDKLTTGIADGVIAFLKSRDN